MCVCSPHLRTPFCGRGPCQWPTQITEGQAVDNNNARALSEITGLSAAELTGIWSDVRLNQGRLDACEGPHAFTKAVDPDRPLFGRWRCALCAGTVDAVAKQWYERGLAHGRGGRLTLPVREA